MDRFSQGFPDTQDEPVFCHCEGCGGEIYTGQEVLKFGAGHVCDTNCLIDALNAYYITAGE